MKYLRRLSATLTGVMLLILLPSASVEAADQDSVDVFSQRFERAFGNELRLSVLAREPDRVEESVDIEAEFLLDVGAEFTILDRPLAFRPLVGVSVNAEGFTNFLFTQVAASYAITDWLFVEGALGATVHDGEISGISQTRLNLGCRVLFRETANVGVRVTPNINVIGGVSHASNGGLCDQNAGVTNFGGRVGLRF